MLMLKIVAIKITWAFQWLNYHGIFDNKTPQDKLDNIHDLVISNMTTNKADISEVDGYVDITANYELENIFYIVKFTSVP